MIDTHNSMTVPGEAKRELTAYLNVSNQAGLMIIVWSLVFLVPFSTLVFAFTMSVPYWLIVVLCAASGLAALPILLTLRNYNHATDAVAGFTAAIITRLRYAGQSELKRAEAELNYSAHPVKQIETIAALPLRNASTHMVNPNPEGIDYMDDAAPVKPMVQYWQDRRRAKKSEVPAEALREFIRAIVKEGHTKSVWLCKPPRMLSDGVKPDGYIINDFRDYDRLIQPLKDYGFIRGRDGETRQPGKLVTTDPSEIIAGLGL
ncbi:MAG: hypothetical protein H0U60_18530 [Blastocatellia bacterium]|nr:hypothetical protein [Blastocatellia bacterium]